MACYGEALRGRYPEISKNIRIPLSKFCIEGNELEYLTRALQSGATASDGYFTKRCHQILEETLGARQALLTTSCTHALELAAMLLGIGSDDEVIVPSFTFVSTATAFAQRGARIVFSDVREDTLNLDERRLESLLTPRTKAIVPVHYAGVASEMDAILEVATRRGIAVVEDNAHGCFGKYRGRSLGTIGTLGALSFHDSKHISCGEGGALLVNDERFASRAEVVRDKGTNRAAYFRGEVDRYSWRDVGSSFAPSDLLAGVLAAQLEAAERIIAKRRRLSQRYEAALSDWTRRVGARLPAVPEGCEPTYHLFYLLLPSGTMRDALMEHMQKAGIAAIFHYLPLHRAPFAQARGMGNCECPVSEDVSARLLRIPFFTNLTDDDQERVISTILEFSG